MAQTGRRLNAGGNRHGGGLRNRSSGDHSGGGEALRVAGRAPRLPVESVGVGAVGIGAGDELGSRRSSGELGVGVREHIRGCGWVLWPPGVH